LQGTLDFSAGIGRLAQHCPGPQFCPCSERLDIRLELSRGLRVKVRVLPGFGDGGRGERVYVESLAA